MLAKEHLSVCRIGYLGPKGTFSQEAAVAYARGANSSGSRAYKLVSCRSLKELFFKLCSFCLEEAVVPVENTVAGPVKEALLMFARCPQVEVSGEIVLPVQHSLLAPPGITLDEIELVVSHPQALAQCAGFLRQQLPAAATKSAPSTAAAARLVGRAGRPWAALGPARLSEIYGLEVLAADASGTPASATRFLVLRQARPGRLLDGSSTVSSDL